MVQDEQAALELARIAGQFAEEEEEKPEKPSNNKGEELLAMMDDLWLIYSVCGCMMIGWLISTVSFSLICNMEYSMKQMQELNIITQTQ